MKALKYIFLFAQLLFLCIACNNETKNSSGVKVDSMEVGTTDNQTEVIIIGDTTNPEELINIIKRLQKKYVRESWGIQEYECFTDVDFQAFKNDGILYKIVNSIEKDKAFKALTERIERMPIGQRTDILSRAENTYKRSWRELNLNPATSSREQLLSGQTEVGSKAERAIAEAVVSFISRQINQ